MEYTIEYGGYADRGFVSLVSGIGVSKIRAGDSFSFAFNNQEHGILVFIAKEVTTSDGFIYWQNITEEKILYDGDTYTVDKDYDDDCFFRIILRNLANGDNNNDLHIGESFSLTIKTKSEKVAKSFLSPKATMISPSISRKSFSIPNLKAENTSIHFFHKGVSGKYFVSRVNNGQGSNLKWYRTNNPDYLSTFCYIKNLSGSTLTLKYTIQGYIYDKDMKKYQWRTPVDDNNRKGLGSISISIPPGKTSLLEYCVRNYGDLSQPRCKIDPYSTNISNNNYETFDFSTLFWRMDVSTPTLPFVILNEESKGGEGLATLFEINQPNHNVMKISQQTFK